MVTFKNKSEVNTKIDLCKNFVEEFTQKKFAQQLLNKVDYENNYFSNYDMHDNLILIFGLSIVLMVFTPIYWFHNPDTFLNLWFSIPYFIVIFLLYLYFIFVKGNESFALLFVKNILANLKIKRFIKKYFNKEENIITIFKFLKHSKFDSYKLDTFLSESLVKKFQYSTIKNLESHLISYEKMKFHEKINDKNNEQSTDFLHEKIDKDIQFFSNANKN